jgi:hypothetical protein
MEKPDTSQTLRQLADKMRRQAGETSLPAFQGMMNRVAETLDAEAELIAEKQSREFAHALEAFCASQFSGARKH